MSAIKRSTSFFAILLVIVLLRVVLAVIVLPNSKAGKFVGVDDVVVAVDDGVDDVNAFSTISLLFYN